MAEIRFVSFHKMVAALLITAVASILAQAAEDEAAQAYLAGDLAKAQKLLAAEIAGGKARLSRYLLLARIHFQQNKWPDARKTLDALLEKDAESPQARELLGRVLFRLERFEEALPYYEESVRQSGRAELRLEMAEVLIGLGRSTDAIRQLSKVVADKRPWPRAHYLLGRIRLRSGLGHWAARHLWVALRLGCRESDLRLKLVNAFLQEGRVTGPLHRAGPFPDQQVGARTPEHLLVRETDQPGVWYVAAADTALYQAEVVVEETESAEARLLAARCWLAAGDVERSAFHLGKVPAGQHSAAAFCLSAEIALAKNDLTEFRRLFDRAPAKRRPAPERQVQYLVDAALAAQVAGDLAGARAFLRDADTILPGRSEVLRPMVEVLARLGEKDEARGKMRLLAELHPDSPEIRMLASRHAVDFESLEKQGRPVLKEDGD